MTLTRLIPSLRRTLPDPLAVDLWPEATQTTVTDVVVSGVSLLRLVEVCGTPCTHSAAAVIPRSGGLPSSTQKATVFVVRVTGVDRAPSGAMVVTTDARLDDPELVWSEIRLIGRASTAHNGFTLVATRPLELTRPVEPTRAVGPDGETDNNARAVDLPRDVRAGDLLALPSKASATTWWPAPLGGLN
jgi:hypothetical protein